MNKKYLPSALILYLNYFIHGVGCSIPRTGSHQGGSRSFMGSKQVLWLSQLFQQPLALDVLSHFRLAKSLSDKLGTPYLNSNRKRLLCYLPDRTIPSCIQCRNTWRISDRIISVLIIGVLQTHSGQEFTRAHQRSSTKHRALQQWGNQILHRYRTDAFTIRTWYDSCCPGLLHHTTHCSDAESSTHCTF